MKVFIQLILFLGIFSSVAIIDIHLSLSTPYLLEEEISASSCHRLRPICLAIEQHPHLLIQQARAIPFLWIDIHPFVFPSVVKLHRDGVTFQGIKQFIAISTEVFGKKVNHQSSVARLFPCILKHRSRNSSKYCPSFGTERTRYFQSSMSLIVDIFQELGLHWPSTKSQEGTYKRAFHQDLDR